MLKAPLAMDVIPTFAKNRTPVKPEQLVSVDPVQVQPVGRLEHSRGDSHTVEPRQLVAGQPAVQVQRLGSESVLSALRGARAPAPRHRLLVQQLTLKSREVR